MSSTSLTFRPDSTSYEQPLDKLKPISGPLKFSKIQPEIERLNVNHFNSPEDRQTSTIRDTKKIFITYSPDFSSTAHPSERLMTINERLLKLAKIEPEIEHFPDNSFTIPYNHEMLTNRAAQEVFIGVSQMKSRAIALKCYFHQKNTIARFSLSYDELLSASQSPITQQPNKSTSSTIELPLIIDG